MAEVRTYSYFPTTTTCTATNRCLAVHINNNQIPDKFQLEVNKLKDKYRYDNNLSPEWEGDIKECELTRLESTFDVRVNVYELLPEQGNACQLVRRSGREKKGKNGDMRIDKSGNHYSLITNFMDYAKTFCCELCQNFITKELFDLKRHKKTCTGEFTPTPTYGMGRFQCRLSVFDELVKRGIQVDDSLRYFRQIVAWDLESCPNTLTADDPNQGEKLKYIDRQSVIAVAINSNVEGFDTLTCLRINSMRDTRELISRMLDLFERISEAASAKERERQRPLLQQLEAKVAFHQKEKEEQQELVDRKEESASKLDKSDEILRDYHVGMLADYKSLKTRLEKHCDCLTLYTFNGGE